MNEQHLQLALRKYPFPEKVFKDEPNEEWRMQRMLNIIQYMKELAAAESANIHLNSAKS